MWRGMCKTVIWMYSHTGGWKGEMGGKEMHFSDPSTYNF